MSLLTAVRKVLARDSPPEPPITVTESGLSFVSKKGPCEIPWKDITQIRALKLDLFAWDEVRFVFALTSGIEIDISEEQPGFEAAISAAKAQFPSIADWEAKLIKPAFIRNETVLFQR